MSNFFSFCSDPGKPIPDRFLYADWELRKKILSGDIRLDPDSHASIAEHFGYRATGENGLNKYEWNPITNKFDVDQINHDTDDRQEAFKWVRGLDFKTVIEPLIIKPIINPFDIAPPPIDGTVLGLLGQWDSVWDSVMDAVMDAVWISTGDSVWASVWAYVSSFFDIKYTFDYSPGVRLWEMGIVPSFDGTVWRLHGGPKAAVLWEGKP